MRYEIFNLLASRAYKDKHNSSWVYFMVFENLECLTFNSIEHLLEYLGRPTNGYIHSEKISEIEINAYYDDGDYEENEVYSFFGKYFIVKKDYSGIVEVPKKDIDFWEVEYTVCTESKHWNNLATTFERFS